MTIYKCDLCEAIIDKEDTRIHFNVDGEKHVWWDDGDRAHHDFNFDLCVACADKIIKTMEKISGHELWPFKFPRERRKS